MPEYVIGRKAIIEYLSSFMELGSCSSPVHKWQKVKRWEKRYGLPIERHINGKPFINPDTLKKWWAQKYVMHQQG